MLTYPGADAREQGVSTVHSGLLVSRPPRPGHAGMQVMS
jgi:hypothetical protein